MSGRDDAREKKSFTVQFGKHARTIDYSDSIGTLLFTFDFDITDKKSLVLEHWRRMLRSNTSAKNIS